MNIEDDEYGQAIARQPMRRRGRSGSAALVPSSRCGTGLGASPSKALQKATTTRRREKLDGKREERLRRGAYKSFYLIRSKLEPTSHS
jgi:hypothetical protein